MRLTHLMNNRVVIARRVPVSGDRLAYVTATVEMMHIQPLGDVANEIRDGTFGKQFRLYCDGSADLKEGDRLRDESGHEYTVVSDGVSRRTYGTMDYIVAVVEKTK